MSAMKTYLVKWKHNSGFQHAPSVIRGDKGFMEVFCQYFHKDAYDAVMNYTVITPYFMNVRTKAFQHPLPVTLYYTQYGDKGRINIEWVDGMVNEEIKNAVRNTAKKSFHYINEVAKDIYDQINNG